MPIPMCSVEGCTKRANFGHKGTKGTPNRTHCAAHGRPLGLVDITLTTAAKCEVCEIRPIFAYPGEKKPTRCKRHILEGQVDIRHTATNCQYANCPTRATFCKPNTKKPVYCKKHAPDTYVDPDSRQCEVSGCIVRPSYGPNGCQQATRCAKHKLDGMEELHHKTCEAEGCDRRPSYGKTRGHPTHCAKHGKDFDLENVVTRTCSVEGCNTVPIYGPEGTNRGIMCKEHGEPLNYIDVRNRKCAHEQDGVRCATQVGGEFKYCAIHDIETERRKRPHELKLADWLRDNLDIPWTSWNKTATASGCGGRYRPDFAWQTQTHVVILECDEDQHKAISYSCDSKRMVDLVNGYGGQPVIFVRYNPDAFKIGKKHRNPVFEDRMDILKEVLDTTIRNVPTDLLTIHRLFYDYKTKIIVRSSHATWEDGQFNEKDFAAFDF